MGPIMFVIFINDMPNAIKNSCMLFADDAKLYRPILTKELHLHYRRISTVWFDGL